MNYYYDIILNWQEEKTYEFYEWNDSDNLELIKKIPLIKVKHKTFIDIINNQIKVEESFLDEIRDKTLVSAKKSFNRIEYATLITDSKNVLAIEWNELGISISRSKLLLDDELNVLEVIYGMKETNLNYEIIGKINMNNTLRQEEEAKKLIRLEINNLYQNHEIDKLKYLYYEYKKEKNDNIDEIYYHLTEDINTKFNSDILKLYYIIKLSYHKV